MKLKTVKRMNACILSAAMVLSGVTIIPPATVSAAANNEINYALSATATVSDQETNYWGADKAIDGIVNRDAAKADQSRWATNQSSSQAARTLTVNLGTRKTFDHFVIEWERTNITNFKISVCDTEDGEYRDVYVKNDGENITSVTSDIQLDEAVTAQYVKLTVNGYTVNPGSWQSVSLYEFKILGEAENLSTAATVTADGSETAGTDASKAVDGDDTTRWASPAATGSHWLKLDYGSEKTIRTAKIHWERKNATAYRIEKSADGENWETVKAFTTSPSDYRETIVFDEAVTTRYLRLYIESFDQAGAPEGSASVSWPTVSVYEFETYETDLGTTEVERTPKEIADSLEVPSSIDGASGNLAMPEVPEGYEISFVGADYEQIVDRDLTVYQPLVTKTVKMNFNVKKAGDDSTAVDSKEYTMTVTGKYTAEDGDNAKPNVMPELAEWKGAKGGSFEISDSSRIVVAAKDKAELSAMAEEFKNDYKEITGKSIKIVYADQASAGDFFFTLEAAGNGLKEEGYSMNVTDKVEVKAEQKAGAYWSTRTILQILKQNGTTIPKGECRDYPKYEVRGFMLDVGRRPFESETLQEVAKTMLWYKMNDLQLHLNDNYIFLENYSTSEGAMSAYEGFRMESDVKAGGLNQADLTSDDMYYTKAEMKSMIQNYRKLGLDIIPEFDTPAHSLSFTKVRPDLRFGTTGRQNDHFNLNTKYDESLAFVESIWDEYIKGDDPVFDRDTIVNIGTDEYDGQYTEQFRKFTDDLLAYIQDNGNTVRLWGSLTARSGSTSVRSEGVQMNIWNDGWANPKAMYQQGYDLIDMNDGSVYIVPAAGYYADYLSRQSMYNYDPATRMGVPSGSEQTLGGAYAIWNDMVDQRANGLTEMEIYDRFNDAAPYYAAALWGKSGEVSFTTAQQTSENLGEAPGVNAYDKVDSETDEILSYDFEDGLSDKSANEYDAENGKNAEVKDGELVLKGGESYISTPLDKVGPEKELSFDITLTQPAEPGQILFEAEKDEDHEAYSTHNIRIMEDGTLGFTREGYDYSFGYKLPVNQKMTLKIRTKNGSTVLIADGKEYRATGSFTYEGDVKKTGITGSTLSLPLTRIGSDTNAVYAIIDNVNLSSTMSDGASSPIDPSGFTVTSDNENSDGPISAAFDNDRSTIWHTQYSPSKKALPATITIDMGQSYDVNGFYYLPRPTGNNGYILKYSLYYEDADGNWATLVENGTWESTGTEKTVNFTPVQTSKIKLVVSEGQNDFGSAAEFRVLTGTQDLTKTQLRMSTYVEGKGTATVSKEKIEQGEEVTFTATAKKGAAFTGWYDVLGTKVSDEAVYTVTPEENLTLIAKFEKGSEPDQPEDKTYTVTIDGKEQTVKEGEKAAKPADPEKEGYKFLGWYEEGSDTAFDFDTAITKNITLTARFEKIEEPDQPDKPSAPENVVTGEITKNSVEVKWDGPASTAGLAGYKIYVNGKEYVTYIPADATGYTIEGLEAGKTYQIEVVAVGDDENATEYAAAELSVTTKSENNGNGGDNGNTGDNGNNGNNGNAGDNGNNGNNGNAGVNNPTKDQNHNAGTTNKKQNAAAKTGDSTNMAVFVFMLGGSLAAGTVVFRRKRR